jgi:hypothetical protein
MSIRFSEPMQVNSDTVVLTGLSGTVSAAVVAAAGSMLAFVNPESSLASNATYTVTVRGAVGTDDLEMPTASFSFTTAAENSTFDTTSGSGGAQSGQFGSDSVWIPTSDWRTHCSPSA